VSTFAGVVFKKAWLEACGRVRVVRLVERGGAVLACMVRLGSLGRICVGRCVLEGWGWSDDGSGENGV